MDASGLALRRVVIYRNGVAYFERQGLVDADQVTFRVRKEKVGDFLATLAVIEAGGSSVRSASFPVEVDDGSGEDEPPAEPGPEVTTVPPPKDKGAPAGKKERDDEHEKVKLTLDGREHDLVVGYVAETPVWRPSYRLVMDAGGPQGAAPRADSKQAHLQAWGIVQNLSGEDWKGVKLSLVAGAPLAFQATLDQAAIPPRPVVSDPGRGDRVRADERNDAGRRGRAAATAARRTGAAAPGDDGEGTRSPTKAEPQMEGRRQAAAREASVAAMAPAAKPRTS